MTLKNREGMILYKNKPLVRRGDIIYYGDPLDKYIVQFKILGHKLHQDLETSTKISISLLQTDRRDQAIKKAEREGLYAAMDIGEYWLNEALEASKHEMH